MKPLIGTDLKRFLRDFKRQQPSRREISAILQSVEYPANVGSIFRLADGAGLDRLWLTGITPTPPHPTIDKVGRDKARRIDWQYEAEPLTAVAQAKADGYHVVALEITDNCQPYYDYNFPDKVCLVVGHEDHGVTKATLAACDGAVFIPMYGKGLSLNVHIALSVVTFFLLQP